MKFMNYGYADEKMILKLNQEDEFYRYNIQLYNKLIDKICITDKKVLEIGCGRGGGIYFYNKYYHVSELTGIDITKQAINYCKRTYPQDNVTFVLGDAQNLPFEDNQFDVVINLESSNNYANQAMFFKEVYRVLKPQGYFAYADIRKKDELKKWSHMLTQLHLELIDKEDITHNVIESLRVDTYKKKNLIKSKIPKILHSQFFEFAGVEGSNYVYNNLLKREKVYIRYLFRKKRKKIIF